MAIYRVKLSASTNGQPITVATGGAAPTTLHQGTTATAVSTSDETHVWFVNNGASTVTVSVYVGTTGMDPILAEVPSRSGPYLILPGTYLYSGVIYATAGATGVGAYGIVNRLTTGA